MNQRQNPISPWWDKDRYADRRRYLTARGAIKKALRKWFEGNGFIETEPGALQVSPGNETHLHAFRTELVGTGLERTPLYLHTSPEFAMKKLLAAGERKIFAFSQVYRNRERGPLHVPEFTMLEWYRVDEPYEFLWQDCADFLSLAAQTTRCDAWSWRDRACEATRPLEPVTVCEAFARYAGIDLRATLNGGAADRDGLALQAQANGFKIAADDTWSDIFSKVLTEAIEPKLGIGRPAVLCEYPTHEAALARPKPHDPSVSERFELYCCGVELANGFGELTNAAEQRARFEKWMDEKERIYGERYPVDEDFLAALAHMPPASGCALGFDRLVMLATGATHIDQVLWTPLGGDA